MLLFVLAALTIFHFALPHGIGHDAALGLLWVALVFTALLGLTRAFVAEREQGMFDALVLAPCDRSAIWLGKTLAVLAFLVAAEVVALPAFAAFFSGVDGRTVAAVALADIGIATVGTLFGAMAVAGRARELLLPLLFLPHGDPDRGRRRGAAYLVVPRCSTTRSSRCSLGVVRVRRRRDLEPRTTMQAAVKTHLGLPALALVCTGLIGARARARSSSTRRPTPTRASRSGSSTSTCRSRSRRTPASAGARGRRCGISGRATSAPTSRATSRSTRA